MHKVMLVDDDYPVLEYLSQAIPWPELDLELIGCYENGRAAYEKAQSDMPDILITDIGMPLMNGLELIRALKEQKPDVRSIIISCHDEFRFAQQAIKLNVHDYILKEALRPQPIIDLLVRLKEDLNRREKMTERMVQSKKLLKSKLIHALINHPLGNPAAWVLQAKEHGLDLAETPVIPVLCTIDQYEESKKKYMSAEWLHHAVEKKWEEMMRMEKNISYFGYSPKEFFLFYPFKRTLAVNVMDGLQQFLKKVQGILSRELNLSVTFSIGEASDHPETLKSQLGLLLNLQEKRFYFPTGCILEYTTSTFSDKDLFYHFSEAVQEFQSLILQQNEQGIRKAASRWIELIRKENYVPKTVKEWVLKLLLDLKLKFKSLHHFQTTFSMEAMDQKIYHLDTLFQLGELMESCLIDMIPLVEAFQQQPKRNEILKVQHYISMNLDKKITLAQVADLLHLNASYFSRLFKKETNENFIEYVNRLKMDKAKELLDQSCKTVEEIAEMLGFENKSYFIKTFKGAVGLSPVEYRMRGAEDQKVDLKDVVK